MRTLIIGTGLCFLLFGCKLHTPETAQLNSPDQRIQVTFSLIEGVPAYAVRVDNALLIKPSKLGYQLRGQPDLMGPFELLAIQPSELDTLWETVWGQENRIRNRYHQGIIRLRETRLPRRFLNLYFRVFDDGLAFRYEIPVQVGLDSLFIRAEKTEFNFASDGKAWWIPADFDSYERLYTESALSALDAVNTPVTVIMDSGVHVSLHEADLTDYAGMTLRRSGASGVELISDLVPWPDGDKVKARAGMVSPWRTITIGRRAADLLNSRMILNLNPPNVIADPSWIRPMKYIGIWWGMHIGKETWVQGPKHGATTANALRHIEFAAANQIQGVLIEGWNDGWEKWGQPGTMNFTKPYDDFDIYRITEYAAEKGVQLIGHHETTADVENYEAQLEAAYAYYHDLGVNAVKTGYVGPIRPAGQHHHGQWMVEHYRRVVKLAARYQVAVDVHEPIKPTGIERTWPNMMTREGGRGMEYNAWSEGNPPVHTTIIPFTRLLAGPMDYTPGIFDLKFDKYKPNNAVHTTLAKQLALMVVLYSPLQMAADLPENYEGQPAFQFIRDLTTDWDETRVLEGEIGEQVALARRSGSDWFVGAITNQKGRDLVLLMNRLIDESMMVDCYVDGPGAHWDTNPYPIWIGSYTVNPGDTLKAYLAPGGGLALHIYPLNDPQIPVPPIKQLLEDQQKGA